MPELDGDETQEQEVEHSQGDADFGDPQATPPLIPRPVRGNLGSEEQA